VPWPAAWWSGWRTKAAARCVLERPRRVRAQRRACGSVGAWERGSVGAWERGSMLHRTVGVSRAWDKAHVCVPPPPLYSTERLVPHDLTVHRPPTDPGRVPACACEREKVQALVRHHFPWLQRALDPGSLPRANVVSSRAPLPPLSNHTVALLRHYYRMEWELYEFAEQLHVRQLQQLVQ
jgi:hypothetical protein